MRKGLRTGYIDLKVKHLWIVSYWTQVLYEDQNSVCLLLLRWCSPVKHFALSRRRSRVQIPAGAYGIATGFGSPVNLFISSDHVARLIGGLSDSSLSWSVLSTDLKANKNHFYLVSNSNCCWDSCCQRMTAFNMCRVMKSHQFCNIWVCKIFNVVPCKKPITIMTVYFLEFQWWLFIYFYI